MTYDNLLDEVDASRREGRHAREHPNEVGQSVADTPFHETEVGRAYAFGLGLILAAARREDGGYLSACRLTARRALLGHAGLADEHGVNVVIP